MATNDTPARLRIGSGETTLGEIELRDGHIEVVSGDKEKLGSLLASMFHARYADEAALFASLEHRLNNGYMWARPVSAKALKKTGSIRPKAKPKKD